MIISCPNCNKKFNIDQSLIPDIGRLLQCSNCMHKWHYIIKQDQYTKKEKIELEKEISVDKRDEIDQNRSDAAQSIKKKNFKKKIIKHKNIKKEINQKNENNEKKNEPIGLLNIIILLLISIVALLVILDTFKSELSLYISFLNPMFDSLYSIVTDIYLFTKDLIR